MKATTVLFALALTACTSSCNRPPSINWPKVAECTDRMRADLLPGVQAVLVSTLEDGDSSQIGERAVEELEQMAARHGASTVACVVHDAVESFDRASPTPPATARKLDDGPAVVAGLSDEELAASRGRDFLKRVAGTRVIEEQP